MPGMSAMRLMSASRIDSAAWLAAVKTPWARRRFVGDHDNRGEELLAAR